MFCMVWYAATSSCMIVYTVDHTARGKNSSRKVFTMRIATCKVLFAVAMLTPSMIVAQAPATLRVGLVTRANSPGASAIQRGVRLGAEEAKQTAKLFGGDVLLFEIASGGDAARAARQLLSQRKVQVLIASAREDVDALSQLAESHRIISVNVASRSPALRAACRRFTFHVEADDSLYAIASRRAPTSGAHATAVLWAPVLEKYGASQINDRFRARYRLGMDGGAWAGWVAMKIVAEAALRARSGWAEAIHAYLVARTTTFDGHKGWPLSFRSADQQLRQPLYIVSAPAGSGRSAVREIPDLAEMRTSSTGANEILDAVSRPAHVCQHENVR